MTTTRTSVHTHLLRLAGLSAVLALGSTLSFAQQNSPSDNGPDPALANLAPADAAAAQANPTQQQGGYQQQAPAPIVREAPGQPAAALAQDNSYNAPPATAEQPDGNPQTDAAVAAGEQAINDANVNASVSADQPPPPLPEYDQPPAPADDEIWTPGYWAYGPVGYYWVPGVWIVPPYYGALWTPPYWGWYGGRYWYHHGYWGLHIGFYGGVNYGFGYIGVGYFGGYWNGGHFFYNRAVTNVGVGVSVTNVYSHTVVYAGHTYGPHPGVRVSYNGGRGGIAVAPRPAEIAAMHESHVAPLAGQARLHASAATNPQAAFSANHGHPAVAVQARPLGGTRVPSADAAGFHQRANVQPQRQNTQPRPQARPAPQPKAAPHPAEHPAEHHDNKH